MLTTHLDDSQSVWTSTLAPTAPTSPSGQYTNFHNPYSGWWTPLCAYLTLHGRTCTESGGNPFLGFLLWANAPYKPAPVLGAQGLIDAPAYVAEGAFDTHCTLLDLEACARLSQLLAYLVTTCILALSCLIIFRVIKLGMHARTNTDTYLRQLVSDYWRGGPDLETGVGPDCSRTFPRERSTKNGTAHPTLNALGGPHIWLPRTKRAEPESKTGA